MKLLLGPGIRLHLKWAEPIQEAELLLSKEKKASTVEGGVWWYKSFLAKQNVIYSSIMDNMT